MCCLSVVVFYCRKSDEFSQSSYISKKSKSDCNQRNDTIPTSSSSSYRVQALKDASDDTLKWRHVRLIVFLNLECFHGKLSPCSDQFKLLVFLPLFFLSVCILSLFFHTNEHVL